MGRWVETVVLVGLYGCLIYESVMSSLLLGVCWVSLFEIRVCVLIKGWVEMI